jgi:radical SAM-linked protein
VEIAYSEGFTPHAQLSLAAPLAVGVTSAGELIDVFLATRLTPLEFMREVGRQLPAGIDLLDVQEVGLRGPSLQSELRAAEYEASLPTSVAEDDAHAAVERFLAAESLPWEQLRDKEVRRYDIRALVQEMWLEQPNNGSPVVAMRLRADSGGAGRPEQVIAAMGLPEPMRLHRRSLLLAETSPAHEAWRRHGRFV